MPSEGVIVGETDVGVVGMVGMVGIVGMVGMVGMVADIPGIPDIPAGEAPIGTPIPLTIGTTPETPIPPTIGTMLIVTHQLPYLGIKGLLRGTEGTVIEAKLSAI